MLNLSAFGGFKRSRLAKLRAMMLKFGQVGVSAKDMLEMQKTNSPIDVITKIEL